jgi:hypothetical protein
MGEFMKVIIYFLLTSLIAFTNVFSQSNTGKWGVGYQGTFLGNVAQGVSIRYWTQERFGIEGNFFSFEANDNEDEAGFYALSGKLLYAPVKKENSRFYIGGEFGVGAATSSDTDEDLELIMFSPIIGSEYHLQGLPEIGFNWDIGYRIYMFSISDYDFDVKGTSVSLGVHYYF